MRTDEATLSITEVMICWTPAHAHGGDSQARGEVKLFAWPDRDWRSEAFDCTAGACDMKIHELTPVARQHFVLSTALSLIVNDGIDPDAVHRALWPLKEYRDGLPMDSRPPRPKMSESDGSDLSDRPMLRCSPEIPETPEIPDSGASGVVESTRNTRTPL